MSRVRLNGFSREGNLCVYFALIKFQGSPCKHRLPSWQPPWQPPRLPFRKPNLILTFAHNPLSCLRPVRGYFAQLGQRVRTRIWKHNLKHFSDKNYIFIAVHYTHFWYEKAGVCRIFAGSQGEPTNNHINGKGSSRAFH